MCYRWEGTIRASAVADHQVTKKEHPYLWIFMILFEKWFSFCLETTRSKQGPGPARTRVGYFAGTLSENIHMLKFLTKDVISNCTETAVKLPRFNMLEKHTLFLCFFS